jgi:hypothetical protein
MASYRQYLIFTAIREFVSDLCNCYESEEDQPVHVFKEYLDQLNNSMTKSEKTIDDIIGEVIDFVKRNEEGIKKKDVSMFDEDDEGIVFDELAFVNVVKYILKEDENTSVIFEHLSTIDYLAQGGLTEEDKLLQNFMSDLFGSTSQMPKLDTDNMSDESLEAMSEVLKPSITKTVENFKTKNLDVDRLMKSVSFKFKDVLKDHDLPGIKKEAIDDILNMAIENDVENLLHGNNKFLIFSKLSSSGFLSNLPLNKLSSLLPSNMEETFHSELDNLSLE